MPELLGIVGSGAIACGLGAAAAASELESTVLVARSEESAQRARARIATLCERFEPPVSPAGVTVATTLDALSRCELHHRGGRRGPRASRPSCLPTSPRRPGRRRSSHRRPPRSRSRSSRSQRRGGALRRAPRVQSGHADGARRARLPAGRERDDTRACARAVRGARQDRDRGSRRARVRRQQPAVPVPLRRRRAHVQTGLAAQELDDCLRLGAGHAIGPLAVLDLVGIDVSIAIGERIGATVPPLLHEMAGDGRLGRKSGRGFHVY